ncbi:MAG: tRNA uridine(34) 5-carboxymethylaminomethyl modification radical SAM/GNAT enzyme Elp3 [Patescibacteria group bacterium]
MSLEQKIILQAISQKINNKSDFDRLRQTVASASGKKQPPNQSILKEYRKLVEKKKIKGEEAFEKILKTRDIRTLSGVAVITVLTKPWPCPGGCVYCPNDPRMPKSYLPKEPAAARALMLKFNPYTQVKKRIEALEANGHVADKIELIVKGGTWSAYPQKYQDWFIKRCFDAANGRAAKKLSEAQKINERAKHRIVGLTLETRPDHITLQEILQLRKLGCTRIELGVQTIDDKILKLVSRGHAAQDVADATALLRNAGFKVDYHLMPALPGVSIKKDLENFKEIFKNPAYCPDMIKIYPCSVIPGTILHKWWKEGKYKPISEKSLAELIIKMKETVPPYVRISRVIRDIPAENISAGSKITNLREYIAKEMERRGTKCRCIRCREIGHRKELQILNFKLQILKYKTLGGIEYFLSIENKNALFAFCRLRLPKEKNNFLPEISNAALIRELHTYGHLVPVDTKISGASQHTGFGKTLMKEAEKIAKKSGYAKMAVISGIGVREYYKKLGYRLKGTYMVKNL